jgi:L-rhamnose isomerase
MSHARVRTLFSAALANFAQQKNMKVSYDNVSDGFDNEDHIESHIIPADTFSETLSGDHKAFIGMFQMTIVTQYGTGYLKTESLVEELQTVFKLNEMFTDTTGFSVQVTSPIHTPEGKQVGGQWRVPCYLNYRADTN